MVLRSSVLQTLNFVSYPLHVVGTCRPHHLQRRLALSVAV